MAKTQSRLIEAERQKKNLLLPSPSPTSRSIGSWQEEGGFWKVMTAIRLSFFQFSTMEGKVVHVALLVFVLLFVAMTGCFLWQYSLPKATSSSVTTDTKAAEVEMCPRYPDPVQLDHPIPILKDALEKVDNLLQHKIRNPGLPALSAIVIYNDTVLWTGNFGRRNGSSNLSGLPNEYSIYRIGSISKLFPTIMLHKLWEDGKINSLDDSLERYAPNFSIKNPLGHLKESKQTYSGGGPSSFDDKHLPPRPSSVTLRRMASQLSGLPRRLRSTSLVWKGTTQEALALLRDDILVADPGTRCHYSNLAFSLLAHVLSEQVAKGDYQNWVSESILDPLGMEDTGFDLTPNLRSRLTVGVYGSGEVAPLYDLGWYRPSGQMFSTAADLAKLAMLFLGTYHRPLLGPETLKVMLTPLLKCSRDYFANKTGTPWEMNEQMGYDVLRKDGDIDGYSATFSLIPKLRLSFILLMAGPRPQGGDLVTQTYEYLIPSLESAFREVKKKLKPPPSPAPYLGYYTFSNLTFYEIKAGPRGELLMQQFGPHIEKVIPESYRTIQLHHLEDRTFQVVFEKEFPCVLKLGPASISLEAQDGQLFNFYPFDPKGLSPGFDVPGLNTYNILRLQRKPIFSS
ncbi:putative beta-lactamase-like 1 isoform X1 [Crotalus tigris]|uniref:putative beta-lactamase-like 1 isoform X1 n=2 Tax=Crotalus tigris TaxID=88082 RepID=UPI00192F4A31|nr:putative beta-lactamase-like 1 isoform X1 [Crotalus tigris]